jgi:hypothetical protein
VPCSPDGSLPHADANKPPQLADSTTDSVDGADKVVAHSNRTGFETAIQLGPNAVARYARAAALTSNGTILGSTPVIDLTTGAVTNVNYTVTRVGNVQVSGGPKSGSGAPDETKASVALRMQVGEWNLVAVILAILVNVL